MARRRGGGRGRPRGGSGVGGAFKAVAIGLVAVFAAVMVVTRFMRTIRRFQEPAEPVAKAEPVRPQAVADAALRPGESAVDPRWSEPDGIAAYHQELKNNFQKLALALQVQNDVYGQLPAATAGQDGRPLLSWRVAVTVSFDTPLFKRFRQDEPWDGPTNRPLLESMPAVFGVPGVKLPPGHTMIAAAVGPGTMFPPNETYTFPKGRREPARCFAVVLKPEHAVPWTKPADLDLTAPGARDKVLFVDDRTVLGRADGPGEMFELSQGEAAFRRRFLLADEDR